jgi:hypothetical protein
VFGGGLHEEADETGIHVEVRQKDPSIGLPAQFEREVAGKGGHSNASLGPHDSNYCPLIRCSDFGDFLPGSPDDVPQSLHEKRTVTDAFRNVEVFGPRCIFCSAIDSASLPLSMRMGMPDAYVFIVVNVSSPRLSPSPGSSKIASMFPFSRRFKPAASELPRLRTNSMSSLGESHR